LLWNRKKKIKPKITKGMFHVEQMPKTSEKKDVQPASLMKRTICIANQKGGVAKTTTAINLSACLAVSGRRVLLVDTDPQGNATSGLGVDRDKLEASVYDLLLGEVETEQVIIKSLMENLDLIPANISLAGAEIEMVGMDNRECRLREALKTIKNNYDYIFIDCPPSLGLLTINALTAADRVLIPIQCEYYALEGVGQLLQTINLVQRRLNPKLELEGVLLTMFDARTNLAIQVVDEVKGYFGNKVFSTIIPRNVRLSEAPSHGKPVIVESSVSRLILVILNIVLQISIWISVLLAPAHK
jgi:chromosome partitioning protein